MVIEKTNDFTVPPSTNSLFCIHHHSILSPKFQKNKIKIRYKQGYNQYNCAVVGRYDAVEDATTFAR
eukprot:m.29029 g.29029  ORF g.29029 m.29029 type:complete len:67 (-) comp6115_c1_seq1:845-1045(-)